MEHQMVQLSRAERDKRKMWGNAMRAVRRAANQENLLFKEDNLVGWLRSVISMCGEYSQQRTAIEGLGRMFLSGGVVNIVAPCCPDYSHDGGKYTFRSLRGGISLLAQKHIEFLRTMAAAAGENVSVLLLIADHEGDDPELCQTVGKTRAEFAELVEESIVQTRAAVALFGWRVEAMTSMIPDLMERESESVSWIASETRFSERIERETNLRKEMYKKINPSLTAMEMLYRTIHTAAQYVALGRWAYRHSFAICNHTTTSLSWYKETGAVILHNPISIY